jgi:hypothetical protein
MVKRRDDKNHGCEHRGQTSPREGITKIVKRGKMETQRNGVKHAENVPAVTLSDIALRVALWLLYGGAAGEMVYGSKTIEEGMGASLSGCFSRRTA